MAVQPDDAREWARCLLDVSQREQAREALLALDEDAVPALVDTFYAGVNEEQGIAVLQLVGEIGGYEAVNLLLDVYENERESWRNVAAEALRRDGFI
ncbi:MAG: hypothetical protein K8L99_19885 [Anaerolineae bacterium]|nr:hypothetical protein [Anaerolineae bacterium]